MVYNSFFMECSENDSILIIIDTSWVHATHQNRAHLPIFSTLKKYVKSKVISYLVFGNVYLCGLTVVYREKWNALKGKALEKGIWFVLFIPRLVLRSLSRLHSLITRFLFCLFSVCMSMCTCDVKSATLYSIQNFKLYI